ncbi:hypothetical protein MUP01_06175 [Candidatus Bathyarchaeota archaeon]|nr:hypothetical protein [Candidatus Bathyarchaeota archaeon]
MPLPLIERSEEKIAQMIRKRVGAMKDVEGIRQLSVRRSGKRVESDMLVLLRKDLGWKDTHRIALDIERKVQNEFPNARVTIHTEPAGNSQESVWRLVKEIADDAPGSRGVHNIHIQKIGRRICVDLHLEVSANMTVKQAHDISDQVEKKIKAANPNISEITIHIESASDRISRELAGVETELESYIAHLNEQFPEIKSIAGIKIRRFGDSLHVVFQSRFDPKLSIEKAHEISIKLERAIRSVHPNITRIDIHEEPA